jgi:hypothetical protein
VPHLIIQGVSSDQIGDVRIQLTQELAKLCQCPADSILLECLPEDSAFEALRAENQRLKDELLKLRKALQASQTSSSSQMSSRLRDALRE